jgi:hypothetical protein
MENIAPGMPLLSLSDSEDNCILHNLTCMYNPKDLSTKKKTTVFTGDQVDR